VLVLLGGAMLGLIEDFMKDVFAQIATLGNGRNSDDPDELRLRPLEAEFWRMVFLMTRCGAALFAVPCSAACKCPRKCASCSPAAWR
jgi:hypothetical protein